MFGVLILRAIERNTCVCPVRLLESRVCPRKRAIHDLQLLTCNAQRAR